MLVRKYKVKIADLVLWEHRQSTASFLVVLVLHRWRSQIKGTRDAIPERCLRLRLANGLCKFSFAEFPGRISFS